MIKSTLWRDVPLHHSGDLGGDMSGLEKPARRWPQQSTMDD